MAYATQNATAVKDSLVLDKSSDWDEWFNLTMNLAASTGIRAYVDPDLPERPALPAEPIHPEPSDIKANARTVDALQDDDLKKYQLRKEDFKSRYAVYSKKSTSIEHFQRYLLNSVTRHNLTFVSDKTHPYDFLKTLRSRVAPTDRARELNVARQYQELKKAPKAQNQEKWLHQWERIYNEAEKLKLPEVQKDRPQYDFLLAVKDLDHTYSVTQQLALETKIRAGDSLPTLYSVVDDYRNYLRINKATSKGSSSHSAFATFQKESDKEDAKLKEGGKSQNSEKKKRDCLCGQFHGFRQCPYLIEHLRSANWRADPEIEKKIQEKLDKSTKLKHDVERIKNQAVQNLQKEKDKTHEADKTDEPAMSVFASAKLGAFATDQLTYKLQHCWALDSAADSHVCNDRSRFNFERPATGEQLYAGKTVYPIEAFGSVKITVKTPSGSRILTLLDVALIPGFLTNVAALSKFTERGVHWDTENQRLHRLGETLCYVERVDGHYILERNPAPSSSSSSCFASRAGLSSADDDAAANLREAEEATNPREQISHNTESSELSADSAARWHAAMGHPGQAAISHLESAVTGATVSGRGPSTIDCEACSVSKAHQLISRRPDKEDPAAEPLARVAYDLIQFDSGYNQHVWVSHFYCYFSTMDFVYTHSHKSEATAIIGEFLSMVKNRYGRTVKYLRTDCEPSLGNKFKQLKADSGITWERTAPYTPAQNGGAERSGGVLLLKARCLRIAAHLPANMWPEIICAAGYLNNRTPKRQLAWKTPIETLTGQKPDLGHLRVYGCRAYPLNKKIPRKQKLEPRAFIGYLVGYDSTNIFKIWIPSQEKVIRTRDVTFDERLFYDPAELDLGHILHEEIENVVELLNLPPPLPAADELFDDEADSLTDPPPNQQSAERAGKQKAHFAEDALVPPESDFNHQQDSNRYPTPESLTDLTALQAYSQDTSEDPSPSLSQSAGSTPGLDPKSILPEGSKRTRKPSRKAAHALALDRSSDLLPYHAAFPVVIDNMRSFKMSRIHRDALPPEPRTWKQMENHPYAQEFKKAAEREMGELERRGTFRWVPKDTVDGMILPLLWVFKYKFDSDGFLTKFKARLCVRGDLQLTDQDTYAATLAARTFRALIAIAAAFDLELRQYDAINAFINSKLNEKIHCYAPEGFGRSGLCWQLLLALYGLKQSPLLWLQEFSAAMEDLGLHPVSGAHCLFTNDWLTLFFYVDDIVVLCSKANLPRLKKFEEALFRRFEMRSLGDLQWFLGIRIIRNRDSRQIWICQDSYIRNLATRFGIPAGNKRPPRTPMTTDELRSFDGQATPQQIFAYQQRVGCLNFAAVISRPDIALSVSKLSQFLQNPSPTHLAAANRVLHYLYATQNRSIEYSGHYGGEIFLCSSDASFADDSETRKSSDGYLFQLFGGPIDWKASKQRTVTTSSTEAELLSLSTAAKETVWWQRFFKEIQFDTKQDISIQCDNRQTIRLLEKDAMKLQTSLRHVDIHRNWLRQEVLAGRIKLDWVPTTEMPADGLTKALPAARHAEFVKQLALVDLDLTEAKPK